MKRIVVSGAAGRMGLAIIRLLRKEGMAETAMLGGALEHEKSPHLGQDAGTLAGLPSSIGVPLVSDPKKVLEGADAVIDFSHPDHTIPLARQCVDRKIPLVVGTTGFTTEQKETLQSYSKDIPLLIAPNMSLGVNLLFKLLDLAAKALGDEYDVEVIEAHHRHKKDAPSGTAQRIKEVLLESLEREESNVVYGREGLIGARPEKEIGVHAIRGGDTVGEHRVFFYTEGERVELAHAASSRDTFAGGAIRAALYLQDRPPGSYSMNDLLGL